jgi:hypothetical protein
MAESVDTVEFTIAQSSREVQIFVAFDDEIFGVLRRAKPSGGSP